MSELKAMTRSRKASRGVACRALALLLGVLIAPFARAADEVTITAAVFGPDGVELTWIVDGAVTVTTQHLEKSADAAFVPASGLAVVITLALLLPVILRRRPRAPWLAVLIALAATAAGAFRIIALLPGDRSYLDADVQAGQTYYYRVNVNGGAFMSNAVAVAVPAPTPTPSPTPQPGGILIQPSNLVIAGSFRIPAGDFGSPQWSGFTYGGTALAYHAANDSLFLVGHAWYQLAAEISIPPLVVGADLDDLATAAVLQELVDPTEGLIGTVDEGSILIGDLLVHGSRLVGTVYTYYDADGAQTLTGFTHSLTLGQAGTVQGMFQIGAGGAGMVSGYMTDVPPEWQEQLGAPALVGQCCIPIISRTSYGPAAFAFDPADFGAIAPVPATPLVYYPPEHPLAAWDATSPLFNGTTQVAGVVFPVGSRSVLFVGRHGIGTFCYGTGEECADPTDDSKGTHAYPYVSQVWAYDVNELLAVRSGAVQPWEVMPYATWELALPFANDSHVLGGVAYDPQTQRIYVSQRNTDGDLPTVTALRVVLP
ncbi:MAG: hypothetical protein HYV63_31400 [Candidatus Schekmanbacteria bacterium]|nr:hypothetical protein [Candidatus Schekmanbacteria bacterium]